MQEVDIPDIFDVLEGGEVTKRCFLVQIKFITEDTNATRTIIATRSFKTK